MNTGLHNLSVWVTDALFTRTASSYFNPLLEIVDPVLCIGETRTRITSIKHHNKNIVTLQLEVPESWHGFRCGQYISVDFDIDGVIYKRNYSISSPESLYQMERKIEITVCRVDGGVVSNWVQDNVKVSNIVTISDAKGELVLPENSARPVVYLCGGSGITPIASMVFSRNSRNVPETLIYSSRNNTHILANELIGLSELDNDFSVVLHSTQAEQKSRLAATDLKYFCPQIESSLVVLCGSSSFVDAMTTELSALNVSDENILFEQFDSGLRPSGDLSKRTGEVVFTGSKKSSQSGETILLQAETLGMDVKSGCRMGICHSCTCTKKSGIVVNAVTGEVSSDDEEEIRICVSVPIGRVEVDL